MKNILILFLSVILLSSCSGLVYSNGDSYSDSYGYKIHYRRYRVVSERIACYVCHGTGRISIRTNSRSMYNRNYYGHNTYRICPHCHGHGWIIRSTYYRYY